MPPQPNKAAAKKAAQRQVLAQWRGIDLSEEEAIRKSPAQSAGLVLPRVLKSLRLEARQAEAELVKVWNHLVDPTITAHAQPSGLRNGTLMVIVDSSSWLSEIVRYHRHEILRRFQSSFGSDRIKRLHFRLG